MAKAPLVIFHKQLGDVLLLEPALAKLAAASGSEVMLATRTGFASMVSLMEGVRPAPEKNPLFQASSVISFDPKAKACLQALLARAPRKKLIVTRPKYLRWWHKLVFHDGCVALDESAYYRAQYFFDVMPGDSVFSFRPPRLKTPPAEWSPPGLPAKYVLLHPTSAWPKKSWSAASWGKVLAALDKMGIGPLVITGGSAPWEKEYVAAVEQEAGVPVINLCGKTSLKGYLSVVAGASLVLCIDGSATHLAAAFQRPSLTLFGPTHPLHWHYPTAISRVLDARDYRGERKPAVAHIPVEDVIKAAASAWEESFNCVT